MRRKIPPPAPPSDDDEADDQAMIRREQAMKDGDVELANYGWGVLMSIYEAMQQQRIHLRKVTFEGGGEAINVVLGNFAVATIWKDALPIVPPGTTIH